MQKNDSHAKVEFHLQFQYDSRSLCPHSIHADHLNNLCHLHHGKCKWCARSNLHCACCRARGFHRRCLRDSILDLTDLKCRCHLRQMCPNQASHRLWRCGGRSELQCGHCALRAHDLALAHGSRSIFRYRRCAERCDSFYRRSLQRCRYCHCSIRRNDSLYLDNHYFLRDISLLIIILIKFMGLADLPITIIITIIIIIMSHSFNF